MPLPPCIPCLVHCLLPWMWLHGCFLAGLTLKKNPCSPTEPRWVPLVFCGRLSYLQAWKANDTCHPTWCSTALLSEWVFPWVPHRVASCTSQHQLIQGSVLHLYRDAGFTCPFQLLSNKINHTRLLPLFSSNCLFQCCVPWNIPINRQELKELELLWVILKPILSPNSDINRGRWLVE